MYFGLHTTNKELRDKVLLGDYEEIVISPDDIHGDAHRPIVWEEDLNRFYEHDIKEFMLQLDNIDKECFDADNNLYINKWKYKGIEPHKRMLGLNKLYGSIARNGIKDPVSVEQTGERLDGSFRTKIAKHLGIKEVKAKMYKIKWQDIDEDFIIRKLEARRLSSGKDYYQFDYGNGIKNINCGGGVYKENAERWELIKDHIEGSVLDIGCNEGLYTIKSALSGHKARGIDHDWIHIANLNRLIFEWVNKKDIDAIFIQDDIANVEVKEDTVLLLNVIYHLKDKVGLLEKCKGKKLIFQCNLRKEKERDKYFGSHPDDLKRLLKSVGIKVVKEIEWKDKPIIIAK